MNKKFTFCPIILIEIGVLIFFKAISVQFNVSIGCRIYIYVMLYNLMLFKPRTQVENKFSKTKWIQVGNEIIIHPTLFNIKKIDTC